MGTTSRSLASGLAGLAIAGAVAIPAAIGTTDGIAHAADATAQTLTVDYGTLTGDFHGGSSGMLYGLGDDGSPTDAILSGARVQVTSQKPPEGLQHPSADVMAVERQFFANDGQQLVVNLQDWYPDWSYNGGKRPGDTRTYNLGGDPNGSDYGTYTSASNGRWDYDEVLEAVMNKILANTSHPDDIVFMPFNEPDGGNWYASGDNASADIYKTFLTDWNDAYATIQKVWNQYKSGEKTNVNDVKPTADHALIAGPGDSAWKPNRTKALLASAKAANTLPDVTVWHELGNGSLKSYRNHYNQYRGFEKELGITPRGINISEFGELRDMSVPGQLIQWMSMFEDTKVQAQTAYWNYAGNLNDNMARANSANGGWWMYKWYGDLRGTKTAKVTSEHPDSVDNLQGIAAIDETNRKATVLYGGANDTTKIGANTPVTVRLTGLDKVGLTGSVDVQVRENAYTGPDGVAATPRVVNVLSGAQVKDGALDVTTTSIDRYAGYQLVVTPHQDTQVALDDAANGRSLQVIEAEDTVLSDGAQSYTKSDNTGSWGNFMFSGNKDVGNFKNGAKMTWNVDVPADGSYRLQLITAPAGFPGTNKVSVDGKSVGDLQVPAELAMKESAKWKYRGSAEIVLDNLTKGKHAITIEATSLDNESDKILLYQMSNGDGPVDQVIYPASDMRLNDGAALSWSDQAADGADADGTNGYAVLAGGSADVYAHAWQAGYQDVTVVYHAAKGTKVALAVNGQRTATLTAAGTGLNSSKVRVALSEGINRLTLSAGDGVPAEAARGVLVRDMTVADASEANTAASGVKAFQAEDTVLGGAAAVKQDASSDATGGKYVSGLGNQFVTNESGKSGYGDQTRVEATSDHVPTVVQDKKGTMTVSGVPAGTYNMVVRFSNDSFIGSHSYNPQVADLGLQVREGGANGKEIARGSFRYTYTDRHFMNRSITVTTAGGDLTFGNWDPAGTGKGAVSWGVAPNVDSVTFYPVSTGEVTNKLLKSDPVTGVKVTSANGVTELAAGVTVKLDAAVTPEGVADAAITWSSSDAKVATVSKDGTVAAAADLAKDTKVTITATAANGVKGMIELTVKAKPSKPSEPSQPAECTASFSDVTGSTPHADDIKWATCEKVAQGYKDGTYGPMRTVVRQDMAAFLYRLAGSPEYTPSEKDKARFTDVNEGTPHAKEIWWLASKGIAKGFKQPDGTYQFGGMRAVVRQDMAAFLKNLAEAQDAAPVQGTGVTFTDVDEKTPHADAIAWLAKAGVTTGWPNPDGGTAEFRGMNVVVRQDMAAFLHRMDTNVL